MRVRDKKTKTTFGRPGVARRRRVIAFLLLWLVLALPEAVLHLATAQGASTRWNSGLVLSILFALVPALMVYGVMMLIPSRKGNFAIAAIYGFVCYILCASQLIYYRVFGTFYSAYSMGNAGQILQFWNIVLKKIRENLPLLLLMAVPGVLLWVFGWKRFYVTADKKPWCLFPVGCAVAAQIVLTLCLPCFGTGDMSAYDLYHNNTDSYFSINRLGMLTAFRLDVTRLVTGDSATGNLVLETPTEATEESTQATEAETEATTAPTQPPVEYNILDIDFDTLIGSESNTEIQEVHQYFASRTASEKNEYTGLFAGCNLVLITAEAFSDRIIDPERTPTLYKMQTEGVTFTNYYVPDWGTSTTDGEYAFLTGTVPKSNAWSFSDSSDNAMPLTMAQQLIAQGYSAYAYHGHTYNYYNRNEYLENLGYTYRAYKQGLAVSYVWPESDVEVVDLSTADFVGNEPFTVYYMSISGHREFNFSGNTMAARNKELVADEPYSTNVRAYLACQLELEKSLTLLMERLEEAGVLENTVFVLTADHYPNGLTVEEYSELAGHELETNFELYKNGCIIYKPGMEPVTVEAPASHLDLLPTLSNLFGLEFDSRLYMGRDVFSDADALVMFRNRSWITDIASYNSNTREVISLSGEEIPDEYVEQISTELSNRFTVSSRVLDYDYWNILFKE